MSDPSESIIEEEVGALEAIYIHELDVKRNDENEVTDMVLQLHPATGDNTNQQYVCMTLFLGIPTEYPFEPPNIEIKNPRGIGEEEVQSTLEAMLDLSIERKGEPVLYELIELAKECLTEGNLPRCACMICLEHFIEGDNFQKTSCYHYFHDVCLGRYVKHALSEKTEVAPAHAKKETKMLMCPVCREEISYSEENFPETPVEEKIIYYPSAVMREQQAEMAAVLEKQRQAGGLIDLEAEKNKYLVTAEDVVYLNNSRSSNNSPNPSSDNLEPLETERVNEDKGDRRHVRLGSGPIKNKGRGSRLKGQPHSDGKLRGNVRRVKDGNRRHYEDERNWEYSEFDGYADYDEPRTEYRGSYERDSAMYKSENRNVESRTRYKSNYDRDSARNKNDTQRPRSTGMRNNSDQNNSDKEIQRDKERNATKEISNDTGVKDNVDSKNPTKTRTVQEDKRNRYRNDNSYHGERFYRRSGKRFNDKPDNFRTPRELENLNSDTESHTNKKALDIKLTKDGTEVCVETPNAVTEDSCGDRHIEEDVTKRKLDGSDRHHSNYDRKDDNRRIGSNRHHSNYDRKGDHCRIGSDKHHSNYDRNDDHRRTGSDRHHSNYDRNDDHRRTGSDRHHSNYDRNDDHRRTGSDRPHSNYDRNDDHRRTGSDKHHSNYDRNDDHRRNGSDKHHSNYDRNDDHRRKAEDRHKSDHLQSGEAQSVDKHDSTNKNEKEQDVHDSQPSNYDRKDNHRRVSDERQRLNNDRKDNNRRVSDERQQSNTDKKDDNRRVLDDRRRSDRPQSSGGRGRRPYRDDKDRYSDNNWRNNREFKSKRFSAGASKLGSSDTGTERKGFGKPSVKTNFETSNHCNSAEITSNSIENDKQKESKPESEKITGNIENARQQRDDGEQLSDNPKRNNVEISNYEKRQRDERRGAPRGSGRGRGFNRHRNIDERMVHKKCDSEKLQQVDIVDKLSVLHIEDRSKTGSDKGSHSGTTSPHGINMTETSIKQGSRLSGPPGFSVKPPPGF